MATIRLSLYVVSALRDFTTMLMSSTYQLYINVSMCSCSSLLRKVLSHHFMKTWASTPVNFIPIGPPFACL